MVKRPLPKQVGKSRFDKDHLPMTMAEVGFVYLSSTHGDRLAPHSYRQYKVNQKILEAYIGNTCIHDVDAYYVDRLYQQLLKDKSVWTANAVMRYARAVWNVNKRFNFVVDNPFSNVRLEQEPERDVLWQLEHIEAFLKTAEQRGAFPEAVFFLLVYETIQRPADIVNLRWRDFKEGGVNVYNRKTKTTVFCIVSEDTMFNVKRLAAHFSKSNAEFVFEKPGGQPLSYSGMYGRCKTVMVAAGLPTDLTFRDLRRTGATEGSEAGWTEEEMMKTVGWKSRSVLNRYARRSVKVAMNAAVKRQAFWQRRREERAAAEAAKVERVTVSHAEEIN